MSNDEIDGSPIDEQEWLQAAAADPAFSDLGDPEEDVYTIGDGKPFAWDSKPQATSDSKQAKAGSWMKSELALACFLLNCSLTIRR